MRVRPVTIAESVRSMEEVVGRSHMLWLRVNTAILHVLKSKRSRAQMVERFGVIVPGH